MRNAPILGNASPTPLSKKGRKNNRLKAEKSPVFTIGTAKLERTKPTTLFLFLNNLKMKPAAKPARVVFNRQVMTVPSGLIGINIAIVDGDNKTINPLKKPNIAPDKGPYNTAAITIVTSDKLMFTGPNCK